MQVLKVSKENSSSRHENPLEGLSVLLNDDLKEVNKIILSRMVSDVPLIPELAAHLIAAGGKRIRPLLTLASSALFDYKGERQYKLASCVEFIHTATLLHDDVVDESDQRRGKSSANAVFGNQAAVLVGDFLFSRAFQLMVEDGSLDVLRILSQASAVIAEGEVLQLSVANDLATTEEQYFQVIRSKTAELFAAACEVGAVVAGRSEAEVKALRDYGTCLGIAFQISDDVLDYATHGSKTGKSVGNDFQEGKMTLPVIKAISRSNDVEKAFFKKCLVNLEQTADDLERAVTIMEKYNCFEDSLKEAQNFAQKGADALAISCKNDIYNYMQQLIFFAANREY